MKVIALVALLSLIGCGEQTKKVIREKSHQSQQTDQLKTGPVEVFSILSHSELPENFALEVNGEMIFDLCAGEAPENIRIDRETFTIDMERSRILETDHLFIGILDRLTDCTGVGYFYLNDRVDFEIFHNKFDGSQSIYARLNNHPRDVPKDETGVNQPGN
jgi:hypothetical protein